MLSFPNLQKIVNGDRWSRFELLYEPLKGRDDDSWWIRVKEEDVRFFFVLVGSKLPSLNLFSTNRKKILKSPRYYLGTELELPSTARRYRPGNLIFVSPNLPSIHFD